MKASAPYWPLKSMVLAIGRDYCLRSLELCKSNSVETCEATNRPEGLHGANIPTEWTDIPKTCPSS